MNSTVTKFAGKISARRQFGAVTGFGTGFGPGGRSSNSGFTATVFGGYGFVGRYFMNELGTCQVNESLYMII